MNSAFSELTGDEIKLSLSASNRLGFKVLMYRDGNWICDPISTDLLAGYGSTPTIAEADCKERNSK